MTASGKEMLYLRKGWNQGSAHETPLIATIDGREFVMDIVEMTSERLLADVAECKKRPWFPFLKPFMKSTGPGSNVLIQFSISVTLGDL